jgi:hypothetical protein
MVMIVTVHLPDDTVTAERLGSNGGLRAAVETAIKKTMIGTDEELASVIVNRVILEL